MKQPQEHKSWQLVAIGGAVSLALTWTPFAIAQTSGNSRLTIQGPAEKTNGQIIRDGLNRPCLDVEAVARAQVVNPAMIDHIVSIKNNCPKVIKVKLCYFNSEKCSQVDMQPYKRVDTILGTMLKDRYFRYTIQQH